MLHPHEIHLAPEEVIDYLRKSRADDPLKSVEEVLENHRQMLDEWSERYLGGIVPPENRFMEIVSGETIKDRPEIQRVLRRIESPKIKAIKIKDVQRLSRGDLEDAGRLIKLLRHTNTLVITMDRIFDLADPYDRENFERELKQGNINLEYQKKIMGDGRLISVSRGNYIGSVPPYGFDKTTVMDGRRKCPTLKENKEQADVVRMVFDLYVNQKLAMPSICLYLEDAKIKPPKGKYWSPSSIKNMLSNVHYIGLVRWNLRKRMTIVEDGQFRNIRPQSQIGEYLIYKGRHAPIISQELFDAAQERMKERDPRIKKRSKMANPLAGILQCECGRMMNYQPHGGTCPPRLVCVRQAKCGNGSCVYEDVENRIADVLKQCIDDFNIRIESGAGNSAALHVQLVKRLEKKLEELQAREISQWEAQSSPNPADRMPQDIFRQLNEKLLREKAEVQQALCDARDAMPAPVDYEERAATFREALEALQDKNADAKKKNRLLKACIDNIVYKRGRPRRIGGDANGWTNPPIELDVRLKV